MRPVSPRTSCPRPFVTNRRPGCWPRFQAATKRKRQRPRAVLCGALRLIRPPACFGCLLGLLAIHAASALDLPQSSSADRPAESAANRDALSPARDFKADAQPTGEAIRKLVAQLDAPRFENRNQATRQLTALGKIIVPYLVESLDQSSREIRFRSGELLRQNFAFADVAPHLVKGISPDAHSTARSILLERAAWQIEVVRQSANTDRLLEFWGTDLKTFQIDVLTNLAEAKGRAETAEAVRPLLGLCDKAQQFELAMARLDQLALPYSQQYSSGFLIAQTLAHGLQQGHTGQVEFAEAYLTAFETLVRNLQLQEKPPHAIKTEVIDRANYSRGAASYLVQLLDDAAPQRDILQDRIGFAQDQLLEQFFQGLASTDRQACYRDVGKVHIIDMLAESLARWPAKPTSPVIRGLISGVKQTVEDGNKPKALAYLDALDACWDVSQRSLNVEDGWGQQCCQRLLMAADQAENNRQYHPTRAVHDRFMKLTDQAIAPGHWAFPADLFARFIEGHPSAVSDEQRLALERYVRMLEKLEAAGVKCDAAETKRFVSRMKRAVTADRDELADGVSELNRLLERYRLPEDADKISIALGQWSVTKGGPPALKAVRGPATTADGAE